MGQGRTGFRHPQAIRQAEGKYPFTMIVAGQTGTAALAVPAVTQNGPLGDDGQSATQNIRLEDARRARLMFGGVGNANQTFNYQVILWHVGMAKQPGSDTIYIPQIIAAGVATLGAMVRPAFGGVAAGKMADGLTDTVAEANTVLENPADDCCALLQVETKGATWLSVETDIVDCTSADVFVALGD